LLQDLGRFLVSEIRLQLPDLPTEFHQFLGGTVHVLARRERRARL
jgi:hypothetical protein